jgi:elongation factor G
VIEMIRERLQARPIAVQVPIGSESSFRGMVDLIENQALTYSGELGTEMQVGPVPAELRAEVRRWREELVERIAETDETLTTKYLEGK